MNDALPHWRTFSSGAGSEPPDAGDRDTAARATRTRALPSSVALLLTGLGGACGGAALVVMAVVILGSASAAGPDTVFGDGRVDGTVGLDELAVTSSGGLMDGAGLTLGADREEIVVDVGGAVARPGLQRLRAGDRVGDAIDAAGGFAPRVDLAESGRSLNLAEPLSDGSKVVVPELGIDVPIREGRDDERIDLNTADQAELETLPGIGPVTASKIIEARSQQAFGTVADLLARGVVGDAVFEDIEHLVRAS